MTDKTIRVHTIFGAITTKTSILKRAESSADSFLYDLPSEDPDAVENAIKNGVVTVDEIVERFGKRLRIMSQ